MAIAAIALSVVLLLAIVLSVWAVARLGWGVRIIALTTAVAVGLEVIIQAWAARALSVGIGVVALVVIGAVFGGWWLSRDLLFQILRQSGQEARW